MSVASLEETRVQNSVLATTLADIKPRIVNNAIDHHPLVSMFTGSLGNALFGRVEGQGRGKRFTSGESIEVRARLGSNDTAKAFTSPYETFTQNTADNARVGRANWKLYGATIIISGFDRRNNQGTERLSSLLAEKTDDAVTSTVNLVSQHCFTNSGVTERIGGLDQVILASGAALHNFDGDTYAPWNSRGHSDKGTAAGSIDFAGGSFAALGLQRWRRAWLGAEEGTMQPDVLVTTEAVYSFYEGSLAPEVRFTDTRVGDLGFRSLTFKGAPLFHDTHATSGVTYFINFEWLEMVAAMGADFDVTPITDQSYQDVFSAKVLWQGNLVCRMRKAENKIISQTA